MVRAINAVGSSGVSPWSTPAKPASVNVSLPGAPKNAAGSVGTPATTAVITWGAPDSDGGGTIIGYKVTAVSDSAKSCSTTGALTCSIADLPAGSYTFVVRAQNAAGFGPASAATGTVTITTVGISPRQFLVGAGGFSGAYTFVLPEAAAKLAEDLTMTLSDVSGRVVWSKTVHPSKGETRVTWDGTTLAGARAPAGVYLVRVRTTSGGAVQEAIQRGVRIRRD
jgi:hypothetical protein